MEQILLYKCGNCNKYLGKLVRLPGNTERDLREYLDEFILKTKKRCFYCNNDIKFKDYEFKNVEIGLSILDQQNNIQIIK